jgi:hypothetical protein
MVGKIVGFGVIGVGVVVPPPPLPFAFPPFPLPGRLFDFGTFELFLFLLFGRADVGKGVTVPNGVGLIVSGKVGESVSGKKFVGDGVGNLVTFAPLLLPFPFCFPLPFA